MGTHPHPVIFPKDASTTSNLLRLTFGLLLTVINRYPRLSPHPTQVPSIYFNPAAITSLNHQFYQPTTPSGPSSRQLPIFQDPFTTQLNHLINQSSCCF